MRDKRTLGERMKDYERVTDYKLSNMPVIIRLDGKAFHTLTKNMIKPFDTCFNSCMVETMLFLCENISNCLFGYTQSDEITLVLDNSSNPWFDNRVSKIASVSASMASVKFNECLSKHELYKDIWFKGVFDSRVFNIPKEDVVNNLIWRQNDATKNSINALAQVMFSHKELLCKTCDDMQEMLFEKGINWNDVLTRFKRGVCCYRKNMFVTTTNGCAIRTRWFVDYEIPILSKNRDFINDLFKEM